MADRVIVMDEGEIIADETPANAGAILKEKNHDMYKALPTPVRVHGAVENSLQCPLTVREGRNWLSEYSEDNELKYKAIPKDKAKTDTEPIIEIKDVYFRYVKELPDAVKGLDLVVNKGEIFCLLGGNGTGKSTMLSLISGLNTPYRGEIKIKGEKISKIKGLYSGILGVLTQNPKSVFVKKTV